MSYRTFRAAVMAAAGLAAVALTPTDALGQLVVTGGPVVVVSESNATFREVPGGEFAPAFTPGMDPAAGMFDLNPTGDGSFTIDPGRNTLQIVSVFVLVQVDVGPLPVQVTPRFASDFKIVNGGGTFDDPDTIVTASMSYRETGTYDIDGEPDALNNLGALVEQINLADELNGNGFVVANGSGEGQPYVLAPGISYTFLIGTTAQSVGSDLGPDSPTAVVTLEAGGISDWDGLTLQVAYQVVPEPSSILFLPAGMILFLLCRR